MLGENIYQLRKANSMSQGDLAELLKVSRQAISKWERDESTPDLEKLTAMAKVFDVSIDTILNDAFDVSDYQVPNRNILSFIGVEETKMIVTGTLILSVISFIISIYSAMRMLKLFHLGFPININSTGVFASFLTNASSIIFVIMSFNVVFLTCSVIIAYLYKKNNINKQVKYFILAFAVILLLTSNVILGLLYLLIAFVVSEQISTIDKKDLIKVIAITLAVILVISYLFYTSGGFAGQFEEVMRFGQ
jgi:transcriptional regulator with XRE-family HTH domain